ncbi:GNAT family N-acetyltransferase [Parafrankia sp. FMc2]|uniref:GNAT family N-acetyltransferase n=1 Tax=Parafrankia sp. FMc2 TaxID=3233196 RepID=UPI0034D58442
MLVRREEPRDVQAVREVAAEAFGEVGRPAAVPAEVTLLDELRLSGAWLPALSLVAESATGEVVGHVLCTRGRAGGTPALALAPVGVRPSHQRRGVGQALMHAVLGAADALGEPLVGLLGDPAYYERFGFRPGAEHGIAAPVPEWGRHFQIRTLATWQASISGVFVYPEPFDHV